MPKKITDAQMLVNSEGDFLPQVYNPVTDQFEALEGQDGATKTQLTGSIVENDRLKVIAEQALKAVTTPVGFRWINHPLDGKIFKNIETGEFITTFDVSALEPYQDGTGVIAYIDPTSGDDTTGDGSESNPYLSMQKALDVGANVLVLSDGIYSRTAGGLSISGNTINNDLVIKAKPGAKPIISCGMSIYSWTKTTGYTNVYEINETSVSVVVDAGFQNSYGDNVPLTNVASIADVDTTEGSYYEDSTSGITYIHLFNGRVPGSNDESVRVYRPLRNVDFIVNGEVTVYFEDLEIEGSYGCEMSNGDGTATLITKNTSFRYADNDGGLTVLGWRNVISQVSEATYNSADGFNYHVLNGHVCNAIEIDCVGRENGDTITQNNGSTMHDGGTIIRMNGTHFKNGGPNVIDISDDTHSWNIGVKSAYPNDPAYETMEAFAIGQTTGRGSMWLDSCTAYGATNVRVGSESHLYIRDNNFDIGTVDGKTYAY